MNEEASNIKGIIGLCIKLEDEELKRPGFLTPDETTPLLSMCASFRIQSRRLAREDLPVATVREELKRRACILEMIARAPAANLEALAAKIEVAEDMVGNEDYTGASRTLLLSCFGDCDRLLDPGIEWKGVSGHDEPVLSSACSRAWDALRRVTQAIETALRADASTASPAEEARQAAIGECWTGLEETLRQVAALTAATAKGVLAKQRILIACLRFDGAAAAFPTLLSSFSQDIDALAAKRRWAASNAKSSGPQHSVI